mmetsp:Transcript_41001/g.131102  ORF Transcript_41001/g.131102 Transcript_41001/m.131102 type:complete len:96 (-) Transcript_41001:154-441(-)
MVQAQGSSSPTSGRRGARPAEVYGFVGWVTSVVLFVVYLTWAYLPEPVLVQLGFVYYPSNALRGGERRGLPHWGALWVQPEPHVDDADGVLSYRA